MVAVAVSAVLFVVGNADQPVKTHPVQNMIATGSIDSDLAIRIWVDPGPKP